MIIMEWIGHAVFDIQCSCGLNISNFDNRIHHVHIQKGKIDILQWWIHDFWKGGSYL